MMATSKPTTPPVAKQRKEHNMTSHADLLVLIDKLRGKKDEIQKRFNEGLTLAQFAEELGISQSTLRTCVNHLGITFRQQKVKVKMLEADNQHQVDALTTVLRRLCIELNHASPELEPFLRTNKPVARLESNE